MIKKMLKLRNSGILILLVTSLFAVKPVSGAGGIVPAPLYMKKLNGEFLLAAKTRVLSSKELKKERLFLLKVLKEASVGAKDLSAAKGGMVLLEFVNGQNSALGTEGYELNISQDTILLRGSATGIFYGIQSLRQLLQRSSSGTIAVPCMEIKDQPRFARRMFMLDEGRHFKGMQVVKEILDEMALLKMNTFHWHLTEDQGWRIQIKKYPLLTTIGGFRDSTENSGWGTPVKTFKRMRHGGFYTQEQIKEVVAYAADRHITVIPEIDMPGHSSAAIAAYPWLSATGEKIAVPGTWGVLKNAYNVADPKVRTFLRSVLDEVLAIFPSKVIHIGGDEVDYTSWKNSAMVQTFMKEKGLKSPSDLQTWFTNDLSVFLASKGRTMMGWNDIMGKKLLDHFNKDTSDYVNSLKPLPGTIIHFWLGDQALIREAAEQGYEMVNAFHENTYFNYPLSKLSLQKAYEFEPIPQNLSVAAQHKIIGVSCQLWSEYVPDVSTLKRQLYPRIAANAEVGWSAAVNKNYNDFINRLEFFQNRWGRN